MRRAFRSLPLAERYSRDDWEGITELVRDHLHARMVTMRDERRDEHDDECAERFEREERATAAALKAIDALAPCAPRPAPAQSAIVSQRGDNLPSRKPSAATASI